LGTAFGEGAARGERRWQIPFWETTASLVCVDDPRSSQYNRLVDPSRLGSEPLDWISAEQMRREDEQYQLGIVVEQNRRPVRPREGSCIFLHLWEGPNRGTIGCTAMDRESLLELLDWLDGARAPHLLQLPRSELKRLQRSGQLPPLLGTGEGQ
jgi:D-alanyl-D-alanine dipeptidase